MQPLTRAGLVLGVGLGGIINGVVLNQMLAWQHLDSRTATSPAETVAALTRQIAVDGWFNFVVGTVAILGVGLLFRAARDWGQIWSPSILTGAILVGWGLISLFESLIGHHLLGIHRVLQGQANQLMLDVVMFVVGTALITGGALLVRAGRTNALRQGSRRADAPVFSIPEHQR